MSKSSRRSFLSLLGSLAGLPLAALSQPVLAAGASRIMEKFRGTAYYRGDDGFERKRKSLVWQAIKPKRYPDRIFEISSEQDIPAALAEARAAGLPVSMVGSGHSYAANGIRDDTVVLDISRLRDLRIDAAHRTAYVQPGIRSAELSLHLQKHGLAFPIAHSPGVGLGGYLLGGGMGWNPESCNNLACFNIRAAEVILASGERVIASADENPDIFWAVRGGGPAFFGIVTGFHLDVFPLPATIRANTHIYSLDAADEIISWMEQSRAAHDAKVELTLNFATAGTPGGKGEAEKQCLVSAVCFADNEAEAKRLLATIGEGAPPRGCVFKQELAPITMADLFATSSDSSLPIRHDVETCWTDNASEAIRRIAQNFASVPSPHAQVFANYRARPALPEDAAYSAMGDLFVLSIDAWPDESQDEENHRWSDGLLADLRPMDKAAYINETDFFRHPERGPHCFSEANWSRLTGLAARYDPGRMFAPTFMSAAPQQQSVTADS